MNENKQKMGYKEKLLSNQRSCTSRNCENKLYYGILRHDYCRIDM